MQGSGATASAASALGSEKSASSLSTAKLRSCVVCRSRKVRCDKKSPCSNCRRANIACVLPSTDRPPRWARRLERYTNDAATSNAPAPQDADSGVEKVMDRLRNLESLVKELRGQLEQAHAAAGQGSSGVNSPESSSQNRDPEQQREQSPVTDSGSVHKQFGRMVLQDASSSRYVSSGFWSRVDDELDGLKMDTRDLAGDESDSSDDEASPGKTHSTQELERTPAERHAFLFRHNLSPSDPDLREFHPLPSLIPFLLDVFSENVNYFFRIVHMPTVTKMVRELRGTGTTRLTPSNEALLFSIYYAAITSMEEDDILTNFGSSKTELSLKYRLGLEHALANADFLNAPDIVLVQAFTIFLCLARRHDSPRFVWMMTGLLVRMAQYLGLQRDGAHFEHLTPFEIEMRRKVWWMVLMLDLRASEDQGTDMTIASGSFDTKIPSNFNDADVYPETKQMPTERHGVTDMSFARVSAGMTDVMRQMTARSVRGGVAGLEEQSRLLNEIYLRLDREYLQHTTETGNIAYWVGVNIARLVMAKMTLIVFLPALFSSPSEHVSDEIRTKLLCSAIEVAEYNHALNAEQACRQWRWIYQTHTHWHAIVYLMIEISRRPWSPIVERAWVALHSNWLIPAKTQMSKNLRIWVPLRKLMEKARQHRHAELNRLRADPQAAARLEKEDQNTPLPSSPAPFPTGSSVNDFRERWRQVVTMPMESGDDTQTSGTSGAGLAGPSTHTTYTSQQTAKFTPAHSPDDSSSSMTFEPHVATRNQQAGRVPENTEFRDLETAILAENSGGLASGQTAGPSHNHLSSLPVDWSDGRTMGPGFVPMLWADADHFADVFSNLDADVIDANMDLDSEVNWYSWVESAQGMELDARSGGNGNS